MIDILTNVQSKSRILNSYFRLLLDITKCLNLLEVELASLGSFKTNISYKPVIEGQEYPQTSTPLAY